MRKTIHALASAACLLCSMGANAALYKLDFTATDFGPSVDNTAAPVASIHGSILFSAHALGTPVTSIEAVDLVIGHRSYTKDEIGGAYFSSGTYLFGGVLNEINNVWGGTDDFYITVPYGSNRRSFVYAQHAEAGGPRMTWRAGTLSFAYTEQTADVPEPASMALLLAGLGGLGLLRRRCGQ